MANNIAVSITADVADLQVKRAIMSAELKAATKDLNAFAREAATTGATDTLREGMLASASAAEKAKASIAQVNAELKVMAATAAPAVEHVEHGFGGLTVGIREMGVNLRESLGTFSEMREAAAAFGEAMIAAFAIERIAEWGKQFAENAEKIKHLAEEFGMTTRQVQGLNVEAVLTGVSLETITKAVGILDKNVFSGKKESLFKQLGIDAKTAKDQVALLGAVADKFKDMDNGPKKAALAMQLFGRAGKDMIPILNQGGNAIREAGEKAKEYGAAYTELSDSAQEKGAALAESINETKVAWMGVTNVLGDAFGPVLKDVTDNLNKLIKAFVDSYTQGGFVAIVFQDIKIQIEVVRTQIDALAGVFSAAWGAISEIVGAFASAVSDAFGIKMPENLKTADIALNEFKDFWAFVKDVIILAIDLIKAAIITLVDSLVMFAKIAWDSFTLNWGAIDADWRNGLAKIDADSRKTANDIRADWANVGTDIANAMAGKGPKSDEKKKEGGGGGGDFDPDLSGGGHKKKGKHGPSIVEKWRAELAESLNDEKNWGVDEARFTEAFWEAKLAQVKKGSAEEIEIRKEIAKDKKAVFKEDQQAEIDAIKQTEDAAITALKSDADLEKAEINRKLANAEYLQKNGEMTAVKYAEIRRALMTDLYALEANEVNNEYKLKVKALKDELDLQHLRPQQRQAILNQIAKLEREHNAAVLLNEKQTGQKLVAEDRNVATAQRQIWQQSLQGFSHNLAQMLTGQQSFFTTVKNMWSSLRDIAARAIENIVQNWLVGLATKTAAERASNQQSVLGDAKNAARKAYNAIVGIPFVGPILAPIAAATAFAAVEAFGAEGGDWQVKEGLYHLHEKEMVLPAHLASPLRSMIQGGGANDNVAPSAPARSNTGTAPRGGDTHNHFNIAALDGHSVKRVLMNNLGAVAGSSKEAHRRGHFAGMKRA